AFAAQARVALQERRLRRAERKVQRKLARRHARPIASAILLERPVVDPHSRAVLFRTGESQRGTRDRLIVKQAPATRIAQRGVRDDDLARRKSAWIPLIDFRPRPKKRHLK